MSASRQVVPISACISMPRLCFTEAVFCATRAFGSMGINIHRHSGAFWDQCANRVLKERVAAGDTYVFMLDYDSVFDRDHVCELIRLMHTTDADAIFPVQVKRGHDEIMCSPYPGTMPQPDEDMTRVVGGHFGLTILRAASVSKLPQPWFWSTPNVDGEWEPGQGRYDADGSFWAFANHADLKVYQANKVRIGHLETTISWPTESGIYRQTYGEFDRMGVPVACQSPFSLEPRRGGGETSHTSPLPPRFDSTDAPPIEAIAGSV